MSPGFVVSDTESEREKKDNPYSLCDKKQTVMKTDLQYGDVTELTGTQTQARVSKKL